MYLNSKTNLISAFLFTVLVVFNTMANDELHRHVVKSDFEAFLPELTIYNANKYIDWYDLDSSPRIDTAVQRAPADGLWSSFAIENADRDSLDIYITMSSNEYHEVYLVRDGQAIDKRITGQWIPVSEQEKPKDDVTVIFRLAPKSTYRIYHLTYSYTNQPVYLYKRIASRGSYYEAMYTRYDENSTASNIQLFFLGASLILCTYFFLLWTQSRTKSYLAYSTYLLFGFLYILVKVDGNITNNYLFSEYPNWRYYLNDPLQMLSFAAYNWFAIEFLDLRKHIPKITKFIAVLSLIYVAYALFHFGFTLFRNNRIATDTLFFASRAIMFPVGLAIIIVVAFKVRTVLTRYLIVGSSIYFIGLALAFLHSVLWYENGLFDSWFAINYMEVGMLGEILLFSLGIGHKIRLTSQQKENYQAQLIEQLRLNEKLSNDLNAQLNEEVNRQTEEYRKQALELERAREKELRLKYEQKIVMSEIQSLRLQMNPHFLFNAMNSIRYYILKKDRKEASNYITRFSQLLRLILKNSRRPAIPISDELQSIKLYVEFEQMRFDQRFEFDLQVDHALEEDTIYVQPMIVQPFVENAIWHGLMQKEGECGYLMVRYEREDDRIRVVIDDNGIGREKAKELKSKGLTQKSFGLQITESRLKMMGHIQDDQKGFEIIDKTNENGDPRGTKVIVYLKIEKNPEEELETKDHDID